MSIPTINSGSFDLRSISGPSAQCNKKGAMLEDATSSLDCNSCPMSVIENADFLSLLIVFLSTHPWYIPNEYI